MKRLVKDVLKYKNYVIYGAKTDLKAEVANSYLNWIWWILEPFCEMLIFTYVFGILFANKEKFFPVYIYSGLIMWNFFSRTINYSVSSVRKNKGIITKIYLPKYILLIENMFLNMFKLFISCGVLAVMMIAYRVPVTKSIIYIIPIFITFYLFCFGCGTIFMHLGVFIDDLSHAISILLRLLFYVSGVFYDIQTRFPESVSKMLYTFNPVALLLKAMHDAILYGAAPDWNRLSIWLIISVILSGIGVGIIYKYENTYVKTI